MILLLLLSRLIERKGAGLQLLPRPMPVADA